MLMRWHIASLPTRRKLRCDRQSLVGLKQPDKVSDVPYAIRETGFHCRSNAERLVYPAKIVVRKMQGARQPVGFDFFGECICQPGESAHLHTHGELLPLDMAGGEKRRIWMTSDNSDGFADKFTRAVAALSARVSVDFNDLRKVDRGKRESGFYGHQVSAVAVRRELNAMSQARRQFAHQPIRGLGASIPDMPDRNQLGLGVNSNPRPDATPSVRPLFVRAIPLFRSAKTPYLITLDALAGEIDHDAPHKSLAGRSEIVSQPRNALAGEAGDAARCALAISLDQARDNACPVGCGEAVHGSEFRFDSSRDNGLHDSATHPCR